MSDRLQVSYTGALPWTLPLILASQSPRRAELLRNAGFRFEIRPANIDEALFPNEDPRRYVARLAFEKAHAFTPDPGNVILAADTVVVINGEVLGKPRDRADARRILELLAGRKHEVLTAVCLRIGDALMEETAVTGVWFAQLAGPEIQEYVESGEPMDKAGAYAIQGIASRFVERIDGSYSNVVGLPVAVVHRLLRRANLSW